MMVDTISAVIRGLSFIALFQATGAAMFVALFGAQLPKTQGLIRHLTRYASVAAMLLVSMHYALEAGRMNGELAGMFDGEMQRMVFESSLRTAWLLRLIGLAAIAIGVSNPSRKATVSSLAGIMLCAVGFAMVGHTAAADARWLAAILMLHVLAVAFWFGALGPLYIATWLESPQHAAVLVSMFSQRALWLVPSLFVAGVLMSWTLMRRWSDLFQPYGLLLLAKAVGFALLMGLASLNKWRYGPALEIQPRARISFQRSLMSEYAIICGILIVTAVLTAFFSPLT